jgi:hypothetical protein
MIFFSILFLLLTFTFGSIQTSLFSKFFKSNTPNRNLRFIYDKEYGVKPTLLYHPLKEKHWEGRDTNFDEVYDDGLDANYRGAMDNSQIEIKTKVFLPKGNTLFRFEFQYWRYDKEFEISILAMPRLNLGTEPLLPAIFIGNNSCLENLILDRLNDENMLGKNAKKFDWFAINNLWINGKSHGEFLIKTRKTSKEYSDAFDWEWIQRRLLMTEMGQEIWEL